MDSDMNKYNQLNFKIPVESEDYSQTSKFVIKSIEDILADAIKKGENKIVINTNLKNGLPMENINKMLTTSSISAVPTSVTIPL